MSRFEARFAPCCPFCGEPVDVYVDPGGGEVQDFIEDCAVCCRPIQFSARYDADAGEYELSAIAAQ
jgi:hypothetical protein